MKGLILPGVGLLLAEVAIRTFGAKSATLASPTAAATSLWAAAIDGSLALWTAQTLGAAMAGLSIGVGLGLVLAAFIGLSPAMSRLFWLPIELARPIPSVVLLPIALLMFGFGYRLEISVVAFACFWPMVIIGGAAIAQIDPLVLEVAQMLRLNWLARVYKIVLPAALPQLFVALRLAAGVALVVAVTVEIAVNPMGLGFAMIQAEQTMQPGLMFGLLAWVGVLGWCLNRILLLTRRRLSGPAATVVAR